MRAMLMGLALTIAAASAAIAQNQSADAKRPHDEQAVRPDPADPPPPGGPFAYAEAPSGWSYPAPGGRYTPFVDRALEGDWSRPTHASDCGHWEEGLEAGRSVWIQTACTVPVTGWSLH
jgi:hypothetical protein